MVGHHLVLLAAVGHHQGVGAVGEGHQREEVVEAEVGHHLVRAVGVVVAGDHPFLEVEVVVVVVVGVGHHPYLVAVEVVVVAGVAVGHHPYQVAVVEVVEVVGVGVPPEVGEPQAGLVAVLSVGVG